MKIVFASIYVCVFALWLPGGIHRKNQQWPGKAAELGSCVTTGSNYKENGKGKFSFGVWDIFLHQYCIVLGFGN